MLAAGILQKFSSIYFTDPAFLKNKLGNGTGNRKDIAFPLELKLCGKPVIEIKFQFAVRKNFKKTERLYTEILEFAVRQRGI